MDFKIVNSKNLVFLDDLLNELGGQLQLFLERPIIIHHIKKLRIYR